MEQWGTITETLTGSLTGEDPDRMPLEDLRDQLVDLELLIGRLEAERARRVAVFDRRGGPGLECHPSTVAFLIDRCAMASGRAQRMVGQARRFQQMPAAWKAFQAGELSWDQLGVLARIPERITDDYRLWEQTLVGTVKGLLVSDTRRVVDYWQSQIDGPGVEADAEDAYRRRYLHISRTLEGMVRIDGLLDPLAGETILEALNVATPPPREGDPRLPAQRRADALTDIARHFLDTGSTPGVDKPHLNLHLDWQALTGQAGGLHETANGTVLTPRQIRQIICDANITRIVFGPDGQPLNIGRTSRIIPPSLRRAVIARDRHCQWPNCRRPAQWCDIHHLIPWIHGGETSLENLQLLCRHHHTQTHQGKHPPTRPP